MKSFMKVFYLHNVMAELQYQFWNTRNLNPEIVAERMRLSQDMVHKVFNRINAEFNQAVFDPKQGVFIGIKVDTNKRAQILPFRSRL
jgi:hypothetical protein